MYYTKTGLKHGNCVQCNNFLLKRTYVETLTM